LYHILADLSPTICGDKSSNLRLLKQPSLLVFRLREPTPFTFSGERAVSWLVKPKWGGESKHQLCGDSLAGWFHYL
jgi:hypothetical protein